MGRGLKSKKQITDVTACKSPHIRGARIEISTITTIPSVSFGRLTYVGRGLKSQTAAMPEAMYRRLTYVGRGLKSPNSVSREEIVASPHIRGARIEIRIWLQYIL